MDLATYEHWSLSNADLLAVKGNGTNLHDASISKTQHPPWLMRATGNYLAGNINELLIEG
ncbi:MAG: hypothetical protein KDB03_23090 [Planctomycetales bacterium]|nr:hypothetical protein [Planctomycetales bacterium]